MRGSSQERRAAVVAPAVVLGMLVLVWAASTGPGRLLFATPATRTIPPGLTARVSPSESSPPVTLEEITENVEQTIDLSWLGDLIAWAVVLGVGLLLCVAAAALVRRAVRDRWLQPGGRPAVEFDVLPEVQAVQALADDGAARLAAVHEGTVRNGIVRCWVRLEEAVGQAGLPRAPHETSAEFTVRVLHRLDLDPHTVGELARLYREARFSEHELGEGSRAAAREALVRLQEELHAVRGAP